mmetsp:Transcript_25269/g.51569  ORF Transcript_25269/g.51569 Transcript_25269/m.51569 type:complete len:483 (-) Transcript_25269:373-1821(-)|eukprot:CAMPEP_0183298448 /NCGR_PEP_ID=MMETSP0160_2-20130417/5460_1 /TAXON_ID=2839 ORGANISM="Odontella Sinensis, Strain Grunow 1884" /NCGR_SAMPLE_ID=MMETSP0160_2 /ASSEMBLY_ACC=CAM_ASM_000250 /LENGTH=482 /DNA_ID=CAMNT_0025460483 /DNA_START=265 /DNA_END=1713 /DNA_ORIENTATION=-
MPSSIRNSALLALLLSFAGNDASAFAPQGLAAKRRAAAAAAPLGVATGIDIGAMEEMKTGGGGGGGGDGDKTGAMIDLNGIAFSGLNGKALSLRPEDFPKAAEIRAVIPDDCYEVETATSLGYLSVSLASTAACTALGLAALPVLDPSNPLTLPFWTAYSAVTGTVAMGLWVLAHECGHGAFSKDKRIQDTVGFVLHSLLLVPYYSWQRSHAVHHQYTNHMDLGETHVPEPMEDDADGSHGLRATFIETLGTDNGIKAWAVLQSFLHLIMGWPAYLLIGATGGPARGMTNHYWPDPLTEPPMPKKELFPGNWKEKVLKSDVGIAAAVGGLVAWAACNGLPEVMALYGGPLIVINAWLVLYTWLQHTDVDVPHFSSEDHTYVRGALHTIDRPYDKLDPFGLIDFLHHKIGSTHVAHHFDSTIPHYKAQAATDAIKESFPQLYLYDPTPIPQALWRVCKGCTAVEKRGDMWIWKNEGLEDKLKA